MPSGEISYLKFKISRAILPNRLSGNRLYEFSYPRIFAPGILSLRLAAGAWELVVHALAFWPRVVDRVNLFCFLDFCMRVCAVFSHNVTVYERKRAKA